MLILFFQIQFISEFLLIWKKVSSETFLKSTEIKINCVQCYKTFKSCNKLERLTMVIISILLRGYTSGTYGTLASPRRSNTLAYFNKRSNFLCLLYPSSMHLSSKKVGSCSKYKKIVHYKLKHLFGAEICVTEVRQASKI